MLEWQCQKSEKQGLCIYAARQGMMAYTTVIRSMQNSIPIKDIGKSYVCYYCCMPSLCLAYIHVGIKLMA